MSSAWAVGVKWEWRGLAGLRRHPPSGVERRAPCAASSGSGGLRGLTRLHGTTKESCLKLLWQDDVLHAPRVRETVSDTVKQLPTFVPPRAQVRRDASAHTRALCRPATLSGVPRPPYDGAKTVSTGARPTPPTPRPVCARYSTALHQSHIIYIYRFRLVWLLLNCPRHSHN